MKSLLSVVVLLAGFTAVADTYPVDEAIADLHAKATYLTQLKEIFSEKNCRITVDQNTVKLHPSQLRSEGLAMGIGPEFPGDFLAYHKAPKPKQLAIVASYTLKKNVGRDVMIVGSRLRYKDGVPSLLLISVNEPYEVPGAEDLWIYQPTWVGVPLTEASKSVSNEATSKSGKAIRLDCGQ